MTDFSPSKVDAAETADSADAVKGNDIDTDGDGTVDAADDAATLGGKSESELDVDKVDGQDAADIGGGGATEVASGFTSTGIGSTVTARWTDGNAVEIGAPGSSTGTTITSGISGPVAVALEGNGSGAYEYEVYSL
jgi:hypothetical protein